MAFQLNDLKLYIDKNGYPRAEVSARYQLIASYLEQDVQRNPEGSRNLIQIIEEVISETRKDWEGTGNAFTLILSKDKARIESEFLDPMESCEIPIKTFQKVLKQWDKLVRSVSS